MPTPLTVQRGYTFGDEPITAAKLNLLGAPPVSIPDGAIPAAALNQPDVLNALKPGLAAVNFIPWGAFAPGSFNAASLAVLAGVRSAFALGWECAAVGGGGATVARDASTPPSSATTGFGAKVYGSTGLTSVDLITPLSDQAAAILKGQTVVLSAWVYNLTSATVGPTLLISTRNAPGSASLTPVAGPLASAASVTAGTWARVYWAIDAAAITNWVNGGEFLIRFSGTALDDVAKACVVTQVQLEIGSLPTPFIYSPPDYPRANPHVVDVQFSEAASTARPRVLIREAYTAGAAAEMELAASLGVVGGKLALAINPPVVIDHAANGSVISNSAAETSLRLFTPSAGNVVAGDTLELRFVIKVGNTSGSTATVTPRLKEGGAAFLDVQAASIVTNAIGYISGVATIVYTANGAQTDIALAVVEANSGAWSVPNSAVAPTPKINYATKTNVTPGTLDLTCQMGAANANLSMQLVRYTLTRIRP